VKRIQVESTINQLMVKRREDKELLLVVTMEGYCHVVENMERLLMIDNR
jgi:hypothetical protein